MVVILTNYDGPVQYTINQVVCVKIGSHVLEKNVTFCAFQVCVRMEAVLSM